MPIRIQFFAIVIPRKVLDQKCQEIGGFEGALKLEPEHVDKRILYDDYLYKDGAMSPRDIKMIADF